MKDPLSSPLESPKVPMPSFTVLLHCSIKRDTELHQSTTIGVSSTDSLLSIKQNITKKMLYPLESYMVQLGSGECILNKDSSEEYLSSKTIGEFVDIPLSAIGSTSVDTTTLKHLTLVVSHTKCEIKTPQITAQITTPQQQPPLHIHTDDNCCTSQSNHEDEVVCKQDSLPQAENANETVENNQNRDADLLKMLYKIITFLILMRTEAELINIAAVMFISFLLGLNHFKLLNFTLKVLPEDETEKKKKLEKNRISLFMEEAKNIIYTFVLSAFPTFSLINSE
ncbi:hypothetical protein MDAP_002432 [Mitosporidium daphniae]